MQIKFPEHILNLRKKLIKKYVMLYSEAQRDDVVFSDVSIRESAREHSMRELASQIESLDYSNQSYTGAMYLTVMRSKIGRILLWLCPVQLLNEEYTHFYEFMDNWDDYMRALPYAYYDRDNDEQHFLCKQVQVWMDFASYINDYGADEIYSVYGSHEPAILTDIAANDLDALNAMYNDFMYNNYTVKLRKERFSEASALGLNRVGWA